MKMVEEMIKDTELNRDVQKIFKVIESCKNENHVTHALKFIDLFVDKWGEIYGKNNSKSIIDTFYSNCSPTNVIVWIFN